MDGKNNAGEFEPAAHCLMVWVRGQFTFVLCQITLISARLTLLSHIIVLNAIILVSTWIRVVYEHEIREMQSCHPVVVIYLESY